MLCDVVVTEAAHDGHREGSVGLTHLPGCPRASLLPPLEVVDDRMLHEVSPARGRVSLNRLLELRLRAQLCTKTASSARGSRRRSAQRPLARAV